ncbi:hypothetical protein BJ508DRAFT_207579 [Ascobolus immersus RN42]|uniref:DDE Tnp4 domain-containing protein n=1 Tax=Ascobolus immersus RN42 TaxID=1160509 RepID=A0A3N4IC43_ASCIM|nr:hypothetical protein BJ508DRAFT_207579 [Ascobolus immersus RN42]
MLRTVANSVLFAFRFTKSEIFRIIDALKVPSGREWRNGYFATSEEAFCLLLFRLSYPHRLKDCMKLFGKSRSWCSMVFNDMAEWLCKQHMDRLRWDSKRHSLQQLHAYAEAIQETCGVSGIWGFVDGTHRGISRPGTNQEDHYAGAKKEHGIRYQGIVTPDGIISLCGPWLGPTGDWKMWQESGIEDELRKLFEGEDSTGNDASQRLYLYGDPAYYPGYGIMGPFRPGGVNMELTPDEEAANIVMSGQRIAVEWAFGLISKYWTFTSFKRANRIGLSPVAAYYLCAAILTNFITCLREHNQISEKFNCPPPTLEKYLGLE